MSKFTDTFKLSIGQRKALAVLALAVVFSNSPVSVSRAAETAAEAIEPMITQASTPAGTEADDQVLTVPEDTKPKPTVQDVLLDVCETRGYGQDCAKVLLGMLWSESSNRSTVIGDSGKARGYFQIHYKLHKISIACAEDLICSANWSLDYLESNSYPKYVKYAVQCHNSCNANNGYVAKVFRNANLFWDKPLEIKQATPIELAMK